MHFVQRSEDSRKRKATLDGSMGSSLLCQWGQDVGVRKHFEAERTQTETILISRLPVFEFFNVLETFWLHRIYIKRTFEG